MATTGVDVKNMMKLLTLQAPKEREIDVVIVKHLQIQNEHLIVRVVKGESRGCCGFSHETHGGYLCGIGDFLSVQVIDPRENHFHAR